jgi:small-conductance mechanosensitive channel
MTLLWLSVTLKLFGVLTAAVDVITDALAARLTIGAVSLSLADILTVLLTVWVSFFIARIVRVVLQEDALPRLSLPRGVPAAISVGANYVILLIGFVFALSAAGLDPGRITLVAGALGVGIGFGLQNIVNNFLSGVILLFERPIQIGDIISFGTINGQVRRIGFRSSTIATFEGAEVVVPNGALVSEHVINWTLSNDQRRIELKVGVAYGNDPTAVIAVLEGAAKTVHDILEQPPVRALFAGFGESSLDFTLWAWTDRQDSFAAVRSELAVAVYDALQAARIEIPFPQREMRVRPVAADAPPPAERDGDKESR